MQYRLERGTILSYIAQSSALAPARFAFLGPLTSCCVVAWHCGCAIIIEGDIGDYTHTSGGSHNTHYRAS
jgi:hypothetical protein